MNAKQNRSTYIACDLLAYVVNRYLYSLNTQAHFVGKQQNMVDHVSTQES